MMQACKHAWVVPVVVVADDEEELGVIGEQDGTQRVSGDGELVVEIGAIEAAVVVGLQARSGQLPGRDLPSELHLLLHGARQP